MDKTELRAQLNHDTRWRKSSKSGPYSDNCVEVAPLIGGFAVRDSTDPTGPALVFNDAEWEAFEVAVAGGEFARD